LHVRRYTSQATRIFKFIPSDVGRPLADIVHTLDYQELQDDAQEVQTEDHHAARTRANRANHTQPVSR
jgi:hypothetical protein